jgi:hypothetical protein|tara:strand:+ start:227 stop:409 length:183 start_codon:yes stop_codon:yes gene_type:complete
MLNKINFKYLVGAISALSLGLLTMAGIVQNYISFASIDNEMGFAVMAMLMGFMCLFSIKK